MTGPFAGAFPPGTQFGAYRIVRPLGKGASGTVYEAIKTSVGKRMALKVLHRGSDVSEDDLVRFEREARIAGAIEHPNVVQVFDVGEHDGNRFMTMELLEGETLQDRLERDGVLSVRDLADLFVPIMSAMGVVHDRGVVHRDLKPGNIFLVSRRQGVVEPKLLDFGVIKDTTGIVGGDMTRAHSMVGSPSYMSPEQAEQANSIDVRSDQFTLGAIMWECLLGRKLFDGETLYVVLFKIADEVIAAPRSLRADVPADLDAIIMRALERDPAKRFASTRQIGIGLLPYCSEHVRAVWREELLASDPASCFDDEVTSMMPSIAPQSAEAFQPIAPAQVQVYRSPTMAPMLPPGMALPLAPGPSWQPAAPSAPPQFVPAATFQPASRDVPPPVKKRSGARVATVLAVVGLAALTVVAVVGALQQSAPAPVTTTMSASTGVPQPAAPTSQPALPSVADSGLVAPPSVTAPPTPAPTRADAPATDARGAHGTRTRHPRARRARPVGGLFP